MGKAEENKLQKKTRLLDTAFRLFTTQGISKTSISDIANEAGVGKGTFYLYFKDKGDIEARLISRRAGQLFSHALQMLDALPTQPETFEDKLIALVDDLLSQLQANPTLLKFIYKNLSWGIFRSAMNAPLSRDEYDYQGRVRKMMEDDGGPWTEPDLMLYTIIELTSSTCYNIILRQDPVPMEVYRQFLYRDIRSIIGNHRLPG